MSLPNPILLVPGSRVRVALMGAALSLSGSVVKAAGDTATYSVVGPNAKPNAADTAWQQLGAVQKVTQDPGQAQPIIIKEAITGVPLPAEFVIPSADPKTTVVFKRIDRIAIQQLWAVAQLGAATAQANPGEGSLTQLAWLQWEVRNHTTGLFKAVDQWTGIRIPNPTDFEMGKEVELTLEFYRLSNPLNSLSI
jgi:hypothetical protein